MSNPKVHHWVPQFYLKQFAIPETRSLKNPQVWVFSKEHEDKDAFRVGVDNVAAERFLYSPLEADGSRDYSTEEKLSGLEAIVAGRWDEIANGFVSFQEESALKKIMSLFLATLMLRHPEQIETNRKINERLTKACEAAPKDPHGNPIVVFERGGKTYPVDLSDWDSFDPLAEEVVRKHFVQNIHAQASIVANDFLKKRWSVIYSESPSFCTSDRPVWMFNEDREKFGTRTPGTTIMFPLSPTRFLMLDDKHQYPSGGYYPIQPGAVGTLGFGVWFNTHRFLISHCDSHFFLREIIHAADTEKLRRDAIWPLKRRTAGRNERCPCKSGKKFKHCCGARLRA